MSELVVVVFSLFSLVGGCLLSILVVQPSLVSHPVLSLFRGTSIETKKVIDLFFAMIMQNSGDSTMNNNNGNDSVNDGDDNSQSGDVELDRNGQHHPVAEFLYQLTKMLTDDNSEIIEWVDGRINGFQTKCTVG